MAKNIVILCDGTGNEPGAKHTNVLRLFDMIPKDTPDQIVWYEPGVGTLGAQGAVTSIGRKTTRILGLAFGYGLKADVSAAYAYLMEHYEQDDRIYIFGFSRGAYMARALSGMLYQIGLLRAGTENLIPYALKFFWWNVKKKVSDETWAQVESFSDQFARPGFPRRSDGKVRFVGVWDTVKAAGLLRGRLVLPWTAKMPVAQKVSHAVSIDEKRRPFKPNLLDRRDSRRSGQDFKEVWFAGVHSDVGGTFYPDHRLADIALEWMVNEAISADLVVDQAAFSKYQNQPESNAHGEIHRVGWKWRIATIGFRRKIVPDGARIHESVLARMEKTNGQKQHYAPKLPSNYLSEPWRCTSAIAT